MRVTCSTHEKDDKCIQTFGRKNLKKRDYLEDKGVDGRILVEWMFGK